MQYQTLVGNTKSLGISNSGGGTVTVKPAAVPQMVQGSLITLEPQTTPIDENGDFEIQIAQTAKIKMTIIDGTGRNCGDLDLHITDDAEAELSLYLKTTPPEVLKNTFIEAALSAEAAAESAEAASERLAEIQQIWNDLDYSLPAGADLSGHHIISSNGANQAVYADNADYSLVKRIIGMTVGSAMAGDTATVKSFGKITEPSWNWDTTKGLYLGSNGTVVQDAPISGAVVSIGHIIDSRTIYIRIGSPIFR